MLTAGDFKNGVTFEMDGKVYQVIEFQHVKPGKGAAFVRTKYKDVMSGTIREQSFNPTAKFENAVIERRDLQYSYDDGDLYHFMDTETWEETLISRDMVDDNFKFVKEEMMCKISSYKGKVFAVDPPTFVELAVTETEPGVQGDTSKAGNKPATLETGYNIQVPLLVNQGDKIRVDTRTGTYMERVK